MAINADIGYIYFNELLYRCMRKKYGNMKINKRMQVFELRTQFQIFLMTREKQVKNKAVDNDEIDNMIIKKENKVNPFLTVMNFKISYKTWLKMARQNIKRRMRESAALSEGTQSFYNEDKPKLCQVEIEIEKYYSTTSEEDSNPEIAPPETFGKKGSVSLASASNNGSVVALSQKKKKDHLRLFEKKMTQKFKSLNANQSMTGSKKKLGKIGSQSVKLEHGPNTIVLGQSYTLKNKNA